MIPCDYPMNQLSQLITTADYVRLVKYPEGAPNTSIAAVYAGFSEHGSFFFLFRKTIIKNITVINMRNNQGANYSFCGFTIQILPNLSNFTNDHDSLINKSW